MNLESQHYKFVDVAKGLGILFIVLGHTVPNHAIHQFLYSFHVPLFFLLSGFTYKLKDNKKHFYLSKFKRLLFPYFAFSIISIIVFWAMSKVIPLSGDSRIIPNILGMLYGDSNTGYMTWNRPLWFLPCLFCSIIILDVVETLLHKLHCDGIGPRLVVIMTMWAVGIFINCYIKGLNLPFHLESAVFLTGFSEVGLLLKKFVNERNTTKPNQNKGILYLSLFVLLLVGIGLCAMNGSTDIRLHKFGVNPVLLVLTSIVFSCATIIFSLSLTNVNFLAVCGASSLSILLMHKFPILFFQEIVPYVRNLLATYDSFKSTLCGILISGLVIILCLVVERIILMICPAIVGKSKQSK